jgi:RecB family exonuclease
MNDQKFGIVFNKTEHIKLSTSSVQTYEQCPRRWYYRYIQKLFPKVEESKWTAFGNFIHDVAENYKDGCSLKEFKELVAERLKFHEIDESYRCKIVPAIKNLYIYCNQRFKPGDVIDRERKIEFHYKDKFFITGKIDVIHARLNDVSVIDWKTSKSEKDHSFQLAIYMFMLEVDGLFLFQKLIAKLFICVLTRRMNFYTFQNM